LQALGLVLSSAGMQVSECRLNDLKTQMSNICKPQHLQSWLGLFEWLGPAFSPLNTELREAKAALHAYSSSSSQPFSEKKQLAVDELLQRLGGAWHRLVPLVGVKPSGGSTFHLLTDASTLSVGAVLIQSPSESRPDMSHLQSTDRLVGLLSKKVPSHGSHWAIYEKEAFAACRAVDKFGPLLAQSPLSKVVIHTDNKCFLDAVNQHTKLASDVQWKRWARWLVTLASVPQVELRSIDGESNVVADFLSRLPGAEDLLPEVGCRCTVCDFPEFDAGWLGGEVKG
jgi:hypothetical protein